MCANSSPRRAAAICRHARECERAQLLPLFAALFAEPNPIPLKAALALLGLGTEPDVRLPLLPATPTTRERLRQALPRRSGTRNPVHA
jgi:4-hydroxy-tetrahydrodipicolinate synthase